MKRMRFPSACLAVAVFAATPAAFAQSSPAGPARIDDIQISREGDTVSILVKLSQQPASATAKANGDGLVLDLNGVSLAKLVLEPPAGSMIRHVEAGDGKVTLAGAAFAETSTVIYRNAVVVEAKLAEPKPGGASLLKPATDEIQPSSEAALPSPEAKTPDAAPANQQPSLATLAKLDTARCANAAVALNKDPWSVPALGDHALCLIDMGSTTEAANRLDRLAAFAPEDWRVALGRAVLAAQKGDSSNAEIGYRNAAMLAPDPEIRAAIAAKYAQPAG